MSIDSIDLLISPRLKKEFDKFLDTILQRRRREFEEWPTSRQSSEKFEITFSGNELLDFIRNILNIRRADETDNSAKLDHNLNLNDIIADSEKEVMFSVVQVNAIMSHVLKRTKLPWKRLKKRRPTVCECKYRLLF